MGTPIQSLWRRISHLPFLNFLRGHEPVPEPLEVPDKVLLDTVMVTFRECEGDCEPTAEQIEAKERERADRFKGDQLLPITSCSAEAVARRSPRRATFHKGRLVYGAVERA